MDRNGVVKIADWGLSVWGADKKSKNVNQNRGKYFKSEEREAVHHVYGKALVVFDISIPSLSFKPISLPLSRVSFILKHPNKSIFNPIKYILTSFYHTLFYCFFIYFFFV